MQNLKKNFSNTHKNLRKNQKKSIDYKKNLQKIAPKKDNQFFENDRLQSDKKIINKIDDNGDVKWQDVQFLTINDDSDGQRLDNFLLGILKGVPKSHLYKLIRDGQIRLNKKRVKPMHKLVVGDVVRVAPIRIASRDTPIVGESLQKALLERVIFEDEGLMVLDKPAGLAVHGGSGESVGVIEAMRTITQKKYLELVHRIDKETSGLLMIAKKRSTLKDLQERLRQKTIQKTYLCIVKGHVNQSEFVIDRSLLKYLLANGERRVKISNEEHAKPSITHVKVLKQFCYNNEYVSLVQCQPKTGRTHQIRVHMASIGHPLLGDEKYHIDDKSAVKRLCLHAWGLEMMGYPILMAKLPNDMTEILQDIEAIDEILYN